jgi:predicted permease
MKWFNILLARLGGLVRRDAVLDDIDEELRLHVEMETEANIARGMSPEEARRAAVDSFGNMGRIKDVAYDIRGGGALDAIRQDLQFGARMLLRKPGFTLVAVITLALGIGANSAIFSVVNAVLLRPLPFNNSERLVTLLVRYEQSGRTGSAHSYLNFTDVRDQNSVFEGIAAYNPWSFFFVGGEETERVTGALASADLFPLLDVSPVLGRVYTREEDQPGAKRVAVISYSLWQRRFGGDPAIIGREVVIGNEPAAIIGVMPQSFKFPITEDSDCWMPLASSLSKASMESRGGVFLGVVARLKPDVTLEQARAEASTIAARLSAQYPNANAGQGLVVQPMHENLVGNVRRALFVILGAVGLVLLIACANVANLLLARAASRQKEIAIRTALGASRARIIRQLLTESLLLSTVGGGLGLLLAFWSTKLLVAASPADIPRINEIGLDLRALGFTLVVTLLTGIIFGLAPALQASKTDFNGLLKEGARGLTASLWRNRLRSLLVVSEVALSLVLLISAGLLVRSFWRLLEVKPGFESDKVLAANVSLLSRDYSRPEQYSSFFREATARLGALPGVQAAGAIAPLPLSNSFESYSFEIEGRAPAAPGKQPSAGYRVVTPDYFRALGIPLVRGRVFDETDRAESQAVTIINETFARRHFPNEDPLGKHLIAGNRPKVAREIVGVIGDVHHAGLDEEPTPEFYVSYLQRPDSEMTIVIRTTGADPSGMAASVRSIIRQISKDQPVYDVRTMNELLSESVARRRFNMLLLGLFASVALLLAAIGLYGVMSYSVSQRTHEIGIRIALGARHLDVLRLVVGQGMGLAFAGVALGTFAAYFVTRVLARMLFGISTTDTITFAGVALLMIAVAFLASYIPARRASKVDPLLALRYE